VAQSIRQQVERVASEAAKAGAHVEERLPEIDWKGAFQPGMGRSERCGEREGAQDDRLSQQAENLLCCT